MAMTHEDTMSHDIIRKQMTESTHFTISFAHLTDLLAEFDAVVAERDRLGAQYDAMCSDRAFLSDQRQALLQERDRLHALLARWLANCTSTHNINGQPICLVQDTYIALGREPLKPLVRE